MIIFEKSVLIRKICVISVLKIATKMKKTTHFLKPLLLILALVPLSLYAQQDRLIDRIHKHTSGLAAWWAGQDSWLIKNDNLLFATDLYFEDNVRYEPSPVTAEELCKDLNILFITHEHDDHFHAKTCKTLNEKSNCIFVLPESCLAKAKEIGISEKRIVVAKPRIPFEIRGVKVSPIRALHGGGDFAILYDANLQDCGYLFTVNGKTLLQPGDTYLLQDHLRQGHVDVLFFSPTEHNTYIDPSVILINTLNPDYIFPQHHSTVRITPTNRFWSKGYPDEVRIRLSKPLQENFHLLRIGEGMEVK